MSSGVPSIAVTPRNPPSAGHQDLGCSWGAVEQVRGLLLGEVLVEPEYDGRPLPVGQGLKVTPEVVAKADAGNSEVADFCSTVARAR